MSKCYINKGKTARSPKRPFEKNRLDAEMKLIGENGLKNKREVWRVQLVLAKIRAAARHLLTLEDSDPKRIFQGTALLRRLTRMGLLNENEQKLDYVLGLTVQKMMERRLQTRVFKLGVAKSIHQARVMIRQRHIRVGKQLVNIPSFMVRVESEKYVMLSPDSPLGGGRPGRVARKKAKSSGGAAQEEEEE